MIQGITPSKEQTLIIDYPGNLVAIARPGSGKTFVMSEKIRSVLENSADYRGAIAISYTNKASAELKRRVSSKGTGLKCSFFGTIDKFCYNEIIFPFLPHIWGRASEELKILRIRGLPQDEQQQFEAIQPNNVSLDVLVAHIDIVKSYFKKGVLLLDMNGALALFTIQYSAACRRYIKARFSHVFIDEYQDAGLEQHALFLELKNLNLVSVAVGDADQSIYGFSGKDSKYLTALGEDKSFKPFPITFNHRCHPSIVNYSLRLLSADSALLDADTLHVYEALVTGSQANIAIWIDQHIATLSAAFDVKKLSDIGILVRSTHTGEIVNQHLQTKHRLVVSHPLEEHFSLWSRVFALLLAYYFNDAITAQEVIDECGSAMLTTKEMVSCRKQIKSIRGPVLPDAAKFVEIATALYPAAESEEAIQLLTDALADEESLKIFHEPAADEVQIMTLHKSKGLEFDIVFHLELYEWVLPGKRPGADNDWDHPVFPSWTQDLNLHYVGITRAKKCCVLALSKQRINTSNETKRGNPSEFLAHNGLAGFRRDITTIL